MFNKSLGSILGVFTKAMTDLDAFMERTESAIEFNGMQMSKLNTELGDLNTDFAKAMEARHKIAEIVGG